MRATVSFDVGVDRVPETMRCLVVEEAHILGSAIERLEGVSCETLAKDIDEVLGKLHEAAHQLHQYRDMLVGFERDRFETILPQPAPRQDLVENMLQVKQAAEDMKRFDSFLGKVGQEDEEEDDNSEEG